MSKVSFKGMKKRRTNFDELEKKFQTGNTKNSNDDRFFYPKRDDQGNGYAVLRFLPTGVDSVPFARYNEHWFQGAGGWFKNHCRNDLNDDACPVCDVNRALVDQFGKWEQVPDREKKIVRIRKRNLRFVANVYVVKDPETPENEGKVMLFKFGAKIMDMIKAAIHPEFEDDEQFDPFNPWEGANFKFKIRKVKGQTNYDSSAFETPGPLFDNDEEIEKLAEYINDLSEFSADAPGFYADYDVQLKQLNRVLGETTDSPARRSTIALPEREAEEYPEAELPDTDEMDEDDPAGLKKLFEDDDVAF